MFLEAEGPVIRPKAATEPWLPLSCDSPVRMNPLLHGFQGSISCTKDFVDELQVWVYIHRNVELEPSRATPTYSIMRTVSLCR